MVVQYIWYPPKSFFVCIGYNGITICVLYNLEFLGGMQWAKTIFFSNRLPVTVTKAHHNIEYQKSIGGLATGLKSYHEHADSVWIGWPGLSSDEINAEEKESIQKKLKEDYRCRPVYLSEKQIEDYYHGFCNKTIWPLFHYFSNKTEYDLNTWEAYRQVNQRFFDAAEPIIENNDIIWIHDYQLMLLPQMIKEKFQNTQVGFFSAYPFPVF